MRWGAGRRLRNSFYTAQLTMADGSGEGRDALSGRRGPDGTGSGVAEQGLALAEHHGGSTHGKEENVDTLDLARSGASARAESDPMVRWRRKQSAKE